MGSVSRSCQALAARDAADPGLAIRRVHEVVAHLQRNDFMTMLVLGDRLDLFLRQVGHSQAIFVGQHHAPPCPCHAPQAAARTIVARGEPM